MFGVYRYVLAALVVMSHLGGLGILGWLAVDGFFILSGYLMTLVMHRSYGYDYEGIWRFLVNRALRLYPIYWSILLIASLVFAFAGENTTRAFFTKLTLPNTVGGWVANLSMIYPQWFPSKVDAAIIPPSWTLTVEWLFYVVIALGLSRYWKRTLCWLLVALSYVVFTYIAGLELEWRYATLAAGALPFAIGAGLFHIETWVREKRYFIESKAMTAWLCGLLMLNGSICILAHAEALFILTEVTFFLNVILNAALIANLSLKERPVGKTILQRCDQILGDLSYPVYLLHLPVAFAVSYYLLGWSELIYDSSTLTLIAMTLIISSVLGLFLNRYPDSYVRKMRDRFRRPQNNMLARE